MKTNKTFQAILIALVITLTLAFVTTSTFASGGSGSGGGGTTTKVDSIKVSKCYYNTGGEMLIKAASSDPTARLFAYRIDGSLIGELQNGGGSRYGGTVMPYQAYDPVVVVIMSTSGGTTSVPTTPFQL